MKKRQNKMTAHELAKVLLDNPDLPIATHADNYTYMSGMESAGSFKVGVLHTYGGDHIVIGNISKRNINGANWHVTSMIIGDVPEEW
jgi:hypothetical protein